MKSDPDHNPDDHSRNGLARLLVAALLLVPPLYVGSYAAIVTPNNIHVVSESPPDDGSCTFMVVESVNYRIGGWCAGQFYWPPEQADRRLFPARWEL